MLDYRIRAFIFLIVGIILIIGSLIVGIHEKDVDFFMKSFAVGIIFIIASIVLKRWYKNQRNKF